MRVGMIVVVAALLVSACGGNVAVPTKEQVAQTLTAAGAQNVHEEAFEAAVGAPKSFLSRQVFALPSVAPAGGQAFICDTKRNCDAMFAYYDALKALAGPYLYQSPSGLVVVQLNSGVPPAEATKFEAAVKALP